MTRRRDARAEDDPALRLLASSFAPVCTLVGKTWSLHLEKVVRVDPEENLRMIADSVAFLVGEGKRVIYDAEHFFDAWRSDRDYALRCVRAAYEAGAENVTLCDTNGASLPHEVAEAVRAVAATGIPVGIHTPQRRRVRRGELARRGRRGRRARAGHAQRLRRALRQREPDLDRPQPPAQAGPRLPARAGGPDRGLAPAGRAAEPHARPERALRRQERVRAQGRDAHRRRRRGPGHVRAHRPRRGRQRARGARLRAVGQGHADRPRRRLAGARGRRPRRRARQGARAPRLPVRGRRRLAGPADPQRDRRATCRCSAWSPGA